MCAIYREEFDATAHEFVHAIDHTISHVAVHPKAHTIAHVNVHEYTHITANANDHVMGLMQITCTIVIKRTMYVTWT